MPNIGDSLIRCLEKNTDVHWTNPNFTSENRSSGLKTGRQKINAIADDELFIVYCFVCHKLYKAKKNLIISTLTQLDYTTHYTTWY